MSKSVSFGRRRFLAGAAALGGAAAVGFPAPAILAQSTKPVQIGALLPFTKVYAVLGESNVAGMQLYLDEVGGSFAGRKVEVIKEDDEVNPQIGLQKLKKLVESDEVDIVVGPQGSNVAMAMVDYVKTSKAFWICSGAGVTALTWNRMPYLFRTSCSAWQHNNPMGQWFYENVAQEAPLFASDFAGGRDTLAEFNQSFVGLKGGKVSKEIYMPIGSPDFSSYLADIRSMSPKGVYGFCAGSDAVRFVKQWAEYGMKERTRLTSSGFMVDSDTLPAQGEAALGIVNAMHYADSLDNPENKAFVEAYRAKHNAYPSVYSEYGYVTAKVIDLALQSIDGDTSDKDKLAEAVAKVSFNAPRGPFAFDPESHNVIHDVYIREVAMVDGRLTNKVIATIEKVRDPAVKPS